MVNQVQRVAHRGGSHLAPENTLSAFRNALTLSVDAIELDVQMSRDGHVIVFHDDTVDRLTDGLGNILDLDFATLRAFDAAAHFPDGWPLTEQIPTLHEVLSLLKGRMRVYIEVKPSRRDGVYGRYPKIADKVVAEVRAAKMFDRVRFISFDWPILTKIKSLEPAVQVGALVDDDLWSTQADKDITKLCDRVISYGCSWIDLDYNLFTDDLPALIHQRGLKLGIWTVNTSAGIERLIAAGVDAITSDRPDLFA